jgi:hypothetical protein
MTQNDYLRGANVFNGPIELGTRIALILTALSDHSLDLDQLVFFDYALLYSHEFSGPENLHPAVPNHLAEIVHRREYLPNALRLFISRGLIDKKATAKGHYYRASENTSQFVSCLRSGYYKKMWTNLSWLEQNFLELNDQRFNFLQATGAK